MKSKLMTAAALLAAGCMCAFPAFADYASFSSAGISGALDISSGPVVYSPSGTSSSESFGPGSSSYVSSSPSSSSAYTGLAGSDHASDEKVTIDLGFTLVSPAVELGDYLVAEGSVQLSDGSWAEIARDKYVCGAYYRLLREETDRTGVDWYVVAANASTIGNYQTADGSYVTELWLKKSDCTAVSALELNTTSTLRQNIVKEALTLLGNKYVYGAAGPDTYDCSGFVYYVMGNNGISLPRNSDDIINYGTEVGLTGLVPGDIVGRSGHVGIYIGGGAFVHAADTDTGVLADSIEVYNSDIHTFTNYRNVIGD